MEIIRIDGVDLPHPSSHSIGTFNLYSSDTTRNELGVLQQYLIRSNIFKIELTFNTKRSPEIQKIEAILSSGNNYNVTFPTESGFITKKMYVGDRKKDVVLYSDVVDNIRWNMSFNLIEV